MNECQYIVAYKIATIAITIIDAVRHTVPIKYDTINSQAFYFTERLWVG